MFITTAIRKETPLTLREAIKGAGLGFARCWLGVALAICNLLVALQEFFNLYKRADTLQIVIRTSVG